MILIYLGKMRVRFSELLLLKCNENAVLFLKTTQNKLKDSFFLEKYPFCYVMFGGCPYHLNKNLYKVYSNKLRNCTRPNNSNKKIHNTLLHSITFSLQKL